MRLTETEIVGIKSAVAEVFGPKACVRLFGSRVDDTLKGGDIDLMVDVEAGSDTFRNEVKLGIALEKRLGERKIDIVLRPLGQDPFGVTRIALRDGVVL